MIDMDVQRLLEEEEHTTPLSRQRKSRQGPRTVAAKAELVRRDHPATPFTEVFASLNDLLRLVYRSTFLTGLEMAALRYRKALATLGCAPTVMMHILVDEVPKFCARHNCGIGIHSEESAESMHFEESKFEGRWHVPPVGSANHGKVLMLSMNGLNAARCMTLCLRDLHGHDNEITRDSKAHKSILNNSLLPLNQAQQINKLQMPL